MNCNLCQLPEISAPDFLRRLRGNDQTQPRVPLTASIELTCACNLRCRHCYIDDRSTRSQDLSLKQIDSIFTDLARHEVLFLVLTGGEPLLRPDFPEIYRLARQLGFVVIIFTNATLVSPSLAQTLLQYPPRRIEVSIYGRTRETYERVTGIPGSFDRFQQGLTLLLDNGLSVELKSVVMQTNQHELQAMRDWATELGCQFRYDPLIHCSLAGDTTPILERIPPSAVLDLQMSNPADQRQFLNYAARVANLPPQTHLFECGAGTQIIHIDARGQAHPCVIWRKHPYDLTRQSLHTGWTNHLQYLRALSAPPGDCSVCQDRGLCGRCAPISLLESGAAGKSVPFHCDLARLRHQFVLAKSITPA
jgi:MoaA/NifB/PqqE/SkfB family radical SAM enzyme